MARFLAVLAYAWVERVASIGQRLLYFLVVACHFGPCQVRAESFKLAPCHRPDLIPFFTVGDDDDIRYRVSGGGDNQISFRLSDFDRFVKAHGRRVYHVIMPIASYSQKVLGISDRRWGKPGTG